MRYVSFDCYGTLIDFQIDSTIRDVFGDRLPAHLAGPFCTAAEAYRFDEVLGPWKPYEEVIARSTERAARRYGVEYLADDGHQIFEAVTTWGPHPDVPEALQTLAQRYPLVILTNNDRDRIGKSAERLGAPFHAVFTSEEAGAYKPRLAAFEYMLAQLGCGPEEVVHVSASPRYDLRPARDCGITTTVFVNRGGEPPQPWLGYREIADLSGLAPLLDGE
jgi:2-haloacid dehalogenase